MFATFIIIFCAISASVNGYSTFYEWFVSLTDEVPSLKLTKFGNKSYYIHNDFQTNYFKATLFCNYHNMRLLTITSESENVFLEKEIVAGYWTSGIIEGVDEWIWMSSGRSLSYKNWAVGEPNNWDEKCLEIMSNGKWNSLGCFKSRYFICEVLNTQTQSSNTSGQVQSDNGTQCKN